MTAGNPSRRAEFLAAFGSLERAAAAPIEEWDRFSLLRFSGGNDIFAPARPGPGGNRNAWVAGQLAAARALGAEIVPLDDPRYPAWLRTLPDPPAVLHILGAPETLAHPAVAVVGARVATPYGLGVGKALGRDLVAAGYAVVSGGARGIDSAAHRGALDAGGVTIAVMGSGLDVPYPKENGKLFEQIAVSGAVVSEFPFGTGPQARFFPFRNRIIAGLAHGVVVVEGARESGSLITARLAADFGREVFAVPGPITSPLSDGPHELIQAGAKLVRRLGDILEELPFSPQRPEPQGLLGDSGGGSGANGGADINNDAVPGGAAILAALDAHGGSTADELSAALGLAPGELLGSLLELELMGRIQQWPGGRFVRKV